MRIQRTDLSPTEIKLLITADEAELKPVKDSVVKRLAKNVKIQGFRSGKAPAAMIEKSIDRDLLQGDFLDEAMTQLYAQATRTENIRPVTRPSVDVKKFVPFSTLEFEVTTSIVGKIKLPSYKTIKVTKTESKVTADDVKGVIESLQTRMAEKNEVTREAKLDDEAVIDFKGVTEDGKPVQGADAKDFPLTLGSKQFIPGFEENVIGMKIGEEKSFTLTFPKDYSVKALANKNVIFTATLKAVNEMTKPVVDDAFAAKVGPFKTVAELKEDIKKQLTVERERESQENYQNDILKAISGKSTVEIPKALIDQQISYSMDELRRNLTYRGQTYQEYLEAEGKTEEELKKEMEPQAADQLKASLILSEIAENEKLSVTPEELELRINLLKGQYGDPNMQAELDKPENRSDIASRMLSEKVLGYLIEAIK